jgi:ATP-binding cassette subfamily B protein
LSTTRRLLGFVAPYRGRVALTVALTALASLLNVPAPLLVQGLVDRIVASGDLAVLPSFAAALLGVFTAQAAVAMGTAYVIGPIGLGVVRDLRHALYARLQKLGLAFYDRTTTGTILSRLMDDVDVVQSLVTGQTLTILADLGATAVVSGLLLACDPLLALAVGR